LTPYQVVFEKINTKLLYVGIKMERMYLWSYVVYLLVSSHT